ncbi:MAG: polysaccharide deacetylase family protein [Pseudomonadota bacterium]|nr:polysaccharide deacetylase family protein [Pseudomonadota bacterium]
MTAKFVISLDMELMWGVRDKASKEQYGSRVLGEREAIPAMLDLFERRGIHATWAVVGMAMCDGVDELLARAPDERPSYADPRQSTYSYLSEAGPSERQDPYYFAPSMIRRIAACPNQEICTHTFSHYYCLEPGQTPAQFAADLDAARKQLADWGLSCRSIVFPRNQYTATHLELCAEKGINVFRGNERSWFYRSVTNGEQVPLRRLGRLVDTYLPVSGSNFADPVREGPVINVPSSRLLRAYNRRLRHIEALRLNRITSTMRRAAKAGSVFHLWWHPHNFGADTDENVGFLSRVLDEYRRLRDQYGMTSATMSEAAAGG